MEPNSFTKTSFCDVEIDNITTNETKQYILNHLNIMCSGMKYNSRYAKVFNEQYSKNLNNPHVLFLKSSGTPYLLFLTQINNTNYCFLIDKKMNEKYPFPKILIVPYTFSNSLYKGTLFECELIRDKNTNWSLGINDIYYSCGKNMKQTIIIDRINTIHTLLEKEYFDSNYSKQCPIFVKKYFDYKDIPFIKDKIIPNLPYNSRGIYFIPMRTDYSNILYLFPRDNINHSKNTSSKNNFLKNSPQKKHKFQKKHSESQKDGYTFRIMKTLNPDVYELYLKEDDNLIKKGTALVQTTELSHKLLSYFETKDQIDEVKVECKYNDKFKKWVPIGLSHKEISNVHDL